MRNYYSPLMTRRATAVLSTMLVSSLSLRVDIASRPLQLHVSRPMISADISRCSRRPQSAASDDFDVSLVEPGSDRYLPCYLAASIERNGETFAALYPTNTPVNLAKLSGDRLVPVDETKLLVETATAACSKLDIELLDTPVVLTAQGPGLEDFDDDADEEAGDEDEEAEGGEEEDAEGGEDNEVESGEDKDDEDDGEAIVLAEFEFQVMKCSGAAMLVLTFLTHHT